MRFTTLILGVLFSHVVSAEATEVLLKARDQGAVSWAQEVLKQFNATIKNRSLVSMPLSSMFRLPM